MHIDYQLYLMLIICYANKILFISFCNRVVATIWWQCTTFKEGYRSYTFTDNNI